MLNISRYIAIGVFFFTSVGMAINSDSIPLADLKNGKYQFCSEPEPKNWLVGAGVCLNLVKTGQSIQGYYGYPHSGDFICIRGQVKANQVIGQAFAIADTIISSPDIIPQSPFKWDAEGHLTLEQGVMLTPNNNHRMDMDGDIQWVKFKKALLDIDGFYRYSHPRMTPVSQLCSMKQFSLPSVSLVIFSGTDHSYKKTEVREQRVARVLQEKPPSGRLPRVVATAESQKSE